MPEVSRFAPGSFCWADLASELPSVSASFYGDLFGWTAVDHRHEPDRHHWVFQIEGCDVAGMSPLSHSDREHGRPPSWNVYIASQDVARDAARSQQYGARILEGPFVTGDGAGRCARILDPGGAIFDLWEPLGQDGALLFGEINTPCWYELLSRDAAQSKAFYGALFGWTLNEKPGYPEWEHAGSAIAGMVALDQPDRAEPSRWRTYFRVDNATTTVVRAKLLDATVVQDVVPVAGVGWTAMLRDPQGARFAIVELGAPE
jgi:predicted enzyme related to lactoylglutathione lyase